MREITFAAIFGSLTFLAIVLIKTWIIVSLGVSFMKPALGECGKTYVIEKHFNIQGSWFCSERGEE